MTRHRALLAATVLVLLVSCGDDGPANLAATLRAGGPVVQYDPEAKPFPEVPLPNNVATRLDDASPTGRFLNISEEADTEMERRIRRKLNRYTGFGLYSPLTVSFDAPIDVVDLHERHTSNRDIGDDGVLLLRLGEGEACADGPTDRRWWPVDVGNGNFPLILERPCQYHYNLKVGDYMCVPVSCEGDDPRYRSSNLIFETYDEDVNGDGKLNAYEDTDYDGHLDKPNTWSGTDSGDAAADDLITFYEKETNTLVLQPVLPLMEATTYAVVLTKNMKGEDGLPVESPFPGVAAADQVPDLQQLEDLLPCYGLTVDDVAFAWTFTTGTPTRELLALREGLYESGTLARLGKEVPATAMRGELARDPDDEGNLPPSPYVLPMSFLQPILVPLAGELLETTGAGNKLASEAVANVDYWVLGNFDSPNLLVDKDGRATPEHPDDMDEEFELDIDTGHVVFEPGVVDFMCAIPKTTDEFRPPFPVVIYGHGYSGASFEILGFGSTFAKLGMATCAVEAPAHGLVIPEDEEEIVALIEMLIQQAGLQNFYDNYKRGRARDLNNDGRVGDIDNGGDFWVGDVFHTRDMLRQLIIDQMQFIRILRNADGERTMLTDTNMDGKDDLVADFDGDGVPDIGGWKDLNGNGRRDEGEPDNPFFIWGQSLGGISSGILAGIEPAVIAAAPSSGAAGLSQVGFRSTNVGVPEAVLLPMLGPFVAFKPHVDEQGAADGRVDVEFVVANINFPGRYVFHVSDQIKAGDGVIVRNLSNGREVHAFATSDLRFRVPIQADALKPCEKRPVLGLTDENNEPVDVTEEMALQLGDALEIVVLDGLNGPEKERIDTVSVPFEFHGARHVEGSPLVALAEGFGHQRNSPDFRRLLSFAQIIMEAADPVAYVPHIFQRRFEFPYETGTVAERRATGASTSFVVYHSVGDTDVPISTGIALARSAGIVDVENIDPRYDRTPNEVLVDHHVVEGVERLMRHPQRKEPGKLCPPRPSSEWRCPPVRIDEEETYLAFYDEEGTCGAADPADCASACGENEACFYDGFCTPCTTRCADMVEAPVEGVHFDVDDLDDRTDRLTIPEYNLDPPLRIGFQNDNGVYGLRIPYLDRYGCHGVPPSIPERAFDINGYVVNQILWLFYTQGQELVDDPCLAEDTCDFFPWNQGE